MPDNDIWPPKPDLPDPLTEYDDVIAAKIAALPETGRSRLFLIKALREEKGIELSQAYAYVNSYCDRHGLFVTGRTAKVFAWGGCALALVPFCLAIFNLYLTLVRREAILRQPHHRAALLALDKEELAAVAAMCVMVLVVGMSRLRHRISRKQ